MLKAGIIFLTLLPEKNVAKLVIGGHARLSSFGFIRYLEVLFWAIVAQKFN